MKQYLILAISLSLLLGATGCKKKSSSKSTPRYALTKNTEKTLMYLNGAASLRSTNLSYYKRFKRPNGRADLMIKELISGNSSSGAATSDSMQITDVTYDTYGNKTKEVFRVDTNSDGVVDTTSSTFKYTLTLDSSHTPTKTVRQALDASGAITQTCTTDEVTKYAGTSQTVTGSTSCDGIKQSSSTITQDLYKGKYYETSKGYTAYNTTTGAVLFKTKSTDSFTTDYQKRTSLLKVDTTLNGVYNCTALNLTNSYDSAGVYSGAIEKKDAACDGAIVTTTTKVSSSAKNSVGFVSTRKATASAVSAAGTIKTSYAFTATSDAAKNQLSKTTTDKDSAGVTTMVVEETSTYVTEGTTKSRVAVKSTAGLY